MARHGDEIMSQEAGFIFSPEQLRYKFSENHPLIKRDSCLLMTS